MNEIQHEEVVIRTDVKAGDDGGSQIGTGNAFGNGQMGSGH